MRFFLGACEVRPFLSQPGWPNGCMQAVRNRTLAVTFRWALPRGKSETVLKPNTLRRQIERWLNEKRGQCYCDDCIAQAVNQAPRRHVQDVTSRLGVSERGFCKYHG